MSLIRWNPYRNLRTLPRDLDSFFNDFGLDYRSSDKVWAPSVDIVETEDNYKLKAEIPGMNKDDIKISFEDHVLTLSGERKNESEENEKNLHRVERFYGKFQRSFHLPEGIKTDDISAKYKDGVLTIDVPKAEEVKPKEIAIK